jgi:hypothetical protein
MSRSNPNDNLTNVATRFYQWDGDNSGFKYFDKTLGEKGESVVSKLPFTFLVLDSLVTVKGYNEPEAKGYYSNEVRNVTTDILTVKSKTGVEMSGTWKEIKEKMASKGAEYTQSLYIAIKNAEGKLEIANIQLKGAALNAWIDFLKKVKINEIAVSVKSSVSKKKGKVVYEEPIYTAVTVNEKTNNEAIELDKQLQEYLTAYLARNASNIAQPTTTAPVASEPVKTAKNESMEESSASIYNTDDGQDPPF